MTLPLRARPRAGLQLIKKSLLWLSAWLKRIDTGAIGGYREHCPTWATIWHTIRFGIFSKSMGSSHLRSARGRRPGESSFKDIGKQIVASDFFAMAPSKGYSLVY